MQFTTFADFMGIGTPELIIILAIVLLLFGGARLPSLAKSIGSSVKELRKGFDDSVKSDAVNEKSVQDSRQEQ